MKVVNELLYPSFDLVYVGRGFRSMWFGWHCDGGDWFDLEKVEKIGVCNAVATLLARICGENFR